MIIITMIILRIPNLITVILRTTSNTDSPDHNHQADNTTLYLTGEIMIMVMVMIKGSQ